MKNNQANSMGTKIRVPIRVFRTVLDSQSTIAVKFKAIKVGCLMLATSFNIGAQNLIPYGDFEQYTALAIELNSPTNSCYNNEFPSGWVSPTLGTPDMINDGWITCDYFHNNQGCGFYPQVCEFDNKMGRQTMMPVTAPYQNVSHVYMGIYTTGFAPAFPNQPFREYIRTNISQPGGLTSGQCYHLTYYVSRGDMTRYATPVQALITNQDLTNTNSFAGVLNPGGAIWCQPAIITNKQVWTRIDYDFIAQGGETYLYLGFFEDENGPIIFEDNEPGDVDYTSGLSSLADNAYYYIDNVSLTPTAGPTFTPTSNCIFTNTNPIIAGYYNNANILISGDVTISGTATFNNCDIRCNDGSTITVPWGSTLIIDNQTSIQAGCANMWDGIIVNGYIYVRGSEIKDAHTAITINNGARWELTRDIQNHNNYFARNIVDMEFNNINLVFPVDIIKATTFDKLPPLHDPMEGVNGYGTDCIIVNGNGGVTPITIGGSSINDACLFVGGQNGIVCSNRNLTIDRCYFASHAQTAIDFQGLNNSGTASKLIVMNSYFANNLRHIRSYTKTDLTVQSSTFIKSGEHAIGWFNNHDCHLIIGDEQNPALGNTFNDNNWSAICAYGNSTAQTVKTTLANPNNTMYTTIVVSNNVINGPPWASGIIISEAALGSDVSYQMMSVANNTISSINDGITISNVRGWGGVFNPQNQPLNLPNIWLNSNQIQVSTQISPTSTGIKVLNSPGLNVSQNGIDSDNRQDWRNVGIRFDISENSEVVNNIVGCGTGIICGGNMISSNVHCNTLVGNEGGIVLGWCALRPSYLFQHGSPQEAYPNNFILTPPWTANIHDYFSATQVNQWVWTNTVTPSYPYVLYTGVTGLANQSGYNTSIISNLEGDFNCPGDPYRIQYAEGPNEHAVFDNSDMQWRGDYNYQVVKNNTNQGSSNYASPNIKRIIRIENAIQSGDYALATAQLNGLIPTNSIEQNYFYVLTIMLSTNSPVFRDLTNSEVAILRGIASQTTRTGGGAVSLARGVLLFQLNMKFEDEDFSPGTKIKGTAFIESPCCLQPASGTVLGFVDQFGNALPISPALVDPEGNFEFDPYQLRYYSDINPNTLYRIVAMRNSKFTVLNRDFKTLNDWMNSSPLEIILGGAKLDYVSITQTQNTAITTSASVTDLSGNIYSVGALSTTSGSDFMVEKRTPAGTLRWTKTYDGPDSGDDTATCITVGSDGNIYVAGKVKHGGVYNFATIKLDTTGFMMWDAILDDTVYSSDPLGISFNPSDTSVLVTGHCSNANQTHYKTVKYKQCVNGPNSNARLTNNAEENLRVPIVSLYPNPNDGTVSISTLDGGSCQLILYNLNGQEVWSQQVVNSNPLIFPENQVPNGVYLCKFTMTDGQTQFEKLIIQRH